MSLDELWAIYSKDLLEFLGNDGKSRKIPPILGDVFRCPLCLRDFNRVPSLVDKISKEHILSRKLGGRLVTVTCRNCNNTDGSNLESSLVQQVLLEAGIRYPQGEVQFDNSRFQAESRMARSDDDYNDIVVIPKASNPSSVKKVWQSLEAGNVIGKEIRHNLDFGFVQRLSEVALIRSAYLYMFWVFGYEYIYDKSAKSIRDLLSDPFKNTSVLSGIQWRIGIKPPSRLCLGIAMEPSELLSSYGVFLTLHEASEHVAMVTLPPFGDDGVGLYTRLGQRGLEGTAKYRFLLGSRVGKREN